MKLLVSACLIGCSCRYDGGNTKNERVLALSGAHTLIPVCPEQLGGLPTPRPPSERRGDRIVTCDGADVTDAFRRGAEEALRICRAAGCEAAVLKARSPSCGAGCIYDGTFSGALTPGDGATAACLIREGIPVYSEETLSALEEKAR